MKVKRAGRGAVRITLEAHEARVLVRTLMREAQNSRMVTLANLVVIALGDGNGEEGS